MFWYFGYGSNMEMTSLRAKGVQPRHSTRAVAAGWRLRFNVQHFFRHEGGVGNIEPTDQPDAAVWGVLHACEDEHLALLDAAEACGHGYDRVSLTVHTQHGAQLACAYVGTPAFINPVARPTQRYLNILLKGAQTAGLPEAYVQALRVLPLHPQPDLPTFVPPPGDLPVFDATSLAAHPLHTALAGHVFDMTDARAEHLFLRGLFGGKDMTLFHLQRMDCSDGSETLDDICGDRLDAAQRRYLTAYLHEYNAEYAYAGRYRHG